MGEVYIGTHSASNLYCDRRSGSDNFFYRRDIQLRPQVIGPDAVRYSQVTIIITRRHDPPLKS